MKNLLFAFLFLFSVSILVTSCKDDDTCYECVGFDDGTSSLEDLGTVCEGGDNGSGGSITAAELEAAVELYEGLGGTCKKK